MQEYRNDPNKFSRYASLIYPEKKEETPENWFARAIREDREARQDREPVQFADASGSMPDFTSGMPDVTSYPGDAVDTVTSLKGNSDRNVCGPESLGVASRKSEETSGPEIVRVENARSGKTILTPEMDPVRGSATINQPLPKSPEPPTNTNVDKGLAKRRFREAVYLYDKFSGGVTP